MKYIEQPDVTLEMVIRSGLLQPGITLYAASDNNVTGTLNVDGSITLIIDGLKKIFPYPSGAARAIRNLSINGWLFWRVKEGQELIELSKFKQKYIEAEKDGRL